MTKKAAFTMVKNEKWFLPLWLSYYSKFFEEKDLYILDHSSTDDSIRQCKGIYPNVNYITLTYEPFDDVFKVAELKKLQTKLFNEFGYDVVLYTDPDEFIVPFNTFNLSDYIDDFNQSDRKSIKCDGWDLIHLRHRDELEIDLNRPILEQRKYWQHNEKWYSKVLLSKEPLNWSPGLHLTNNTATFDCDLKLIHLHRFDYELSYLKNIYNSQFKRPPGMNLGNHVFITDPEEFEQHFWIINDELIETIPQLLIDTKLF